MKKFLTSVVKIGLGFFVGFLLLAIVVGMFGSNDSKDSSAPTSTPIAQSSAEAEKSTGNETPATTSTSVAQSSAEAEKSAGNETPATTVTETEKSTGNEVAAPTEDQTKDELSDEYKTKLAEQKEEEEETPDETEEETPDETEKSTGTEVAAPTETSTQKTSSVYDIITWDYYKTTKINDYTIAPSGKNYYVVTIRFNNTGTDTYSTNAFYWKLTADGVTYTTDASTFSMPGYKLVDVGPGGKTDSQFVFLVDGEPTDISLEYNGF